jgi:L-fuconolactonase
MKIDAHQHFWVYNESEYGWINEEMGILKKDYLPVNLQPEIQKAGIDGTIVVQARQSLEETRWLLKLAGLNNFIKGVVGWVDLCSSDVRNQLIEFVSFPQFVGVRHVIHDEPDDDFILRKDFLNGIKSLEEFGLVFDILIFPRHLKNTIQLASLYPGQTFVLNHIAKPNIKGKMISPWKEDIKQLALLPNVYCKISGMVTETDWGSWQEKDFIDYLDVIFKAFGTSRLMIGSDWPVCKLAATYPEVIHIVENYLLQFSEEERKKVLGLNALTIYKINLQ